MQILNRKQEQRNAILGGCEYFVTEKHKFQQKLNIFLERNCLNTQKKLKIGKSDFPFKSSINFCISYKHFTFEMAWFAATLFCKKNVFGEFACYGDKKTKICIFFNIFFLQTISIFIFHNLNKD